MIEKKVLFISNSIVGEKPGISGGESRFIELGKYWKKMGYEIHLLSSEGGRNLCEKMGLPVLLHKIPSTSSESRAEVVRRMFSLLWYVPRLLTEYKSGIVYSTSEQIYDVWAGFILKLFYRKNIRFVSAVHWLPPIIFWRRKASKWYNSLLFLISERLGLFIAYLSSDALFPVSDATYKDMVRAGLRGAKIKIVKCGVNLIEIDKIRHKVEGKKVFDAVFLKRIQSVKGIFDLIDIWEIVCSSINDAQLIIIGSGIDEVKAKRIVSEKNLEGNIKFLGAIYDIEDKFTHVCKSKLFLLPSYEENWAIVIGESLACGTPVIVYQLKELEEVWEDSIDYISLGDKEKFAELVIKYLTKDSEYENKVKRGLDYIKQYDWDKISSEEIEFIMECR